MSIRRRLAAERGDTLISTLLALALVLLVVGLTVQALMYVHTRSVAQAAAQDGVEAAISEGSGAGMARAKALLGAAGGVGSRLHPSIESNAETTTVVVRGSAPHIFPGVSLVMPSVSAKASAPLERYPQDETRQ
jgi:hypothetical protein